MTAPLPRIKSFKDALRIYISGICMGSADVVPGISGGTIAFIMGFYEDLINSIKSFNARAFSYLPQLRFKQFLDSTGWDFLLILLLGIVTAFATLATAIDHILGDPTYRIFLYSAFLGLIIASVIFCAKQIPKWLPSHYLALIIGGVAAFILSGSDLMPHNKEPLYDVAMATKLETASNYDAGRNMLLGVKQSDLSAMLAKQLIQPTTIVYNRTTDSFGTVSDFVEAETQFRLNPWIILCGMIAICALLLPGISGSYLLNILGAYGPVLGALADFLTALKHFSIDYDAAGILGSMLIGIIIGALTFSHVVSWLLRHYHNYTIAFLTGCMIGALRAVWPFWSYSYQYLPLKLEKGPQLHVVQAILPDFSGSVFYISLLCALAGFTVVYVLECVAHRTVTKP